MKIKPEISIVCARYDDYYPAEYVNRLYRAVARNLTVPYEFICIAGDKRGIDPAIHCVPILHGLKYWWCGMPMLQKNPPYVNTPNILGIGLDCVIVGSLDNLARFPSDFAVNKDYPPFACPPGREEDGNGEVCLNRNGAGSFIWDEYVRLGMPNWDPQSPPPNRAMAMCGMDLYNGPQAQFEKDLFPAEWVVSYKLWVRERGLPADCRIVSFHGRPKQHEVTELWIKEHWY